MKQLLIFFSLLSLIATFAALEGCYYDEVVPESVIVKEDVSFAADIMPVFNSSCNISGCHRPGGPPPDLSPENAYDALIDGGYISLEIPEDSELYQWLIGNRDVLMPPAGINASLNAKVLAWIKQGAENN